MPPIPDAGNPGMPPTPPGIPGADASQPQPLSPQEKSDLLNMIAEIKAKLGSLNATRFASSNANDKLRQQLLQEVFQKLQMAGVDLTSPDSVKAFIQNLQQNNPELAANFEKAMAVLLGQPGAQAPTPGGPAAPGPEIPPPPGGDPSQNMNIPNQNETLPQG